MCSSPVSWSTPAVGWDLGWSLSRATYPPVTGSHKSTQTAGRGPDPCHGRSVKGPVDLNTNKQINKYGRVEVKELILRGQGFQGGGGAPRETGHGDLKEETGWR